MHLLKGNDSLSVTLSNTSNQAYKLFPGSVIAQLSPVTLTNCKMTTTSSEEIVLPDLSKANLPIHEKKQVENLINEYSDIFSQGDLDLGHYSGVQHRIELEDERPFKQRYRRIPPHMFDEVADHLKQLETNGVVRPSKSPFSSPVVCVRKKDGGLRMCVDFRLLNSRRKKDNHCIPRVDDILDSLHGAKYFTRLDLKSGFHQIEIAEDHKERTAFTVGPLGFF